MKKGNMIWVGIGVVAAAVIGYVAFFSPSPSDQDLQGAVGAAQQYRAEQIAEADVVLQDPEIQELLQSDFFYKLATDDEFRKVAVDQLARLDLACGRGAQFTCAASLAEMKSLLDLATTDSELKTALAEGKMNVVATILVDQKRPDLIYAANRVYLTQGRDPAFNAKMHHEMKSFLGYALGSAEMKAALANGRTDVVYRLLASGKHPELNTAAQKVFVAESYQSQLDAVGLADMKVLLDLAATDPQLKSALTEGRMNAVSDDLAASNRSELLAAAHRVYLTQGSDARINAEGLDNMRSYLDFAMANPELRLAVTENRIDRADAILTESGRSDLSVAAHKVSLTDKRQEQIANASLENLKVFLSVAAADPQLKAALATGKMDVVNKILIANNKSDLIYAANRIYLTQGTDARLNAEEIGNMKSLLDAAWADQELKQAIATGKIDRVDEALIYDGKSDLCTAANRLYLTSYRRPNAATAVDAASMKSIVNFAQENAEFRQALQDGQLDAAARIALAAGKYDISLRSLAMANYVVGEGRSFVTDLNRLYTVSESPSYKLSAANAGWGRLLATTDAASWKQTVDAVADGKMVQNY